MQEAVDGQGREEGEAGGGLKHMAIMAIFLLLALLSARRVMGSSDWDREIDETIEDWNRE